MSIVEVATEDKVRAKRYRQAALLLQKWAAEDPAYDERTGSSLDRELTDSAMKCEDKDETPA
jgi:hypothetical protein